MQFWKIILNTKFFQAIKWGKFLNFKKNKISIYNFFIKGFIFLFKKLSSFKFILPSRGSSFCVKSGIFNNFFNSVFETFEFLVGLVN